MTFEERISEMYDKHEYTAEDNSGKAYLLAGAECGKQLMEHFLFDHLSEEDSFKFLKGMSEYVKEFLDFDFSEEPVPRKPCKLELSPKDAHQKHLYEQAEKLWKAYQKLKVADDRDEEVLNGLRTAHTIVWNNLRFRIK